MTTILWFRQDLRLSDNPALTAALTDGTPVVPVYILTADEGRQLAPGRRISLVAASQSQTARRRSASARLAPDPAQRRRLVGGAASAGAHVRRQPCGLNRRYEPAVIARDQIVKARLREQGIHTDSYNGALLHEPWTVKTKTGGPFQVFHALLAALHGARGSTAAHGGHIEHSGTDQVAKDGQPRGAAVVAARELDARHAGDLDARQAPPRTSCWTTFWRMPSTTMAPAATSPALPARRGCRRTALRQHRAA